MSDPLVLRSESDNVATLTLNRPRARNALSLEMMRAFLVELEAVAADPSVRVLVIEGAGPTFCAGHDLKEMNANNQSDFMAETFETCGRLMQAIIHLPQPVIAKVHGIATAAGCQLVASCDLAVATDDAKFATPGVNIGLFCSTPMVALTRNVAPKHAMEMLLTGDLIDAQHAARIGLINRTVEGDVLDATVNALATKVAASSPKVVQFGKQNFYAQQPMDLSVAYAAMAQAMAENMGFEDAREGITAFLEKRSPDWKNA